MRETLTAIAEIDLAGPILVGLAARAVARAYSLRLALVECAALCRWRVGAGALPSSLALLPFACGALAWLGASFLLAGALGLLLARGLMLRFLGRPT